MNTVYRAGSWFVLVGPEAAVALPPDAEGALVAQLWERVTAEGAFSRIVDALTVAGGGSFSAIPPFAAVVREGQDARIAVRGRVHARVFTTDGAQEITGAEVTTWSERFVPAVTGIEIRVEEGGADPALPIVAGVVRAASLTLGVIGDSAPVTEAVGGSSSAVPAPPAGLPDEAAPVDPSPAAEVPGRTPTEGAVPVTEVPDAAARQEPAPAAEVSEPPADPAPISGVPERTLAGATTQEPAPLTADPGAPLAADPGAPLAAAPDVADLDDLDDTVLSVPAPVETILPPADTIAAPLGGHTIDLPAASLAPSSADDGDHDGATISLAQARALRGDLGDDLAALSAAPAAPAGRPATDAPLAEAPVTAVPGITEDPGASSLPATAGPRIRLSSGQVIALDRTVVIGRRPRATRSSGASLPHLVAVDSPQQDISRSHLEIRPDSDAVVVLDLHTTNGSTLLRPGKDPMRLHPGEQTVVVTDDVIDLGDGVTVAFEELP